MRRRRRRRSLGFTLRNRRKLITIWVLLASLALWSWVSRQYSDTAQLEQQVEEIIRYLVYFFIAAAILFAARLFYTRRQNIKTSSLGGFKYKPWNYDRDIISLVGQVEHVFPNTVDHRIKTKVTDVVRSITKDHDPSGRYIHQRFLISSPLLKKGNNLMVTHNTQYGKLPIKKGKWLDISGVYLHSRAKTRTAFGKSKLTFYGKLHYTHKPKGKIQILPEKPIIKPHHKVLTRPDQKNS